MHYSEYTSCDRLRNGIDFELDRIELCCFRCHKGGGNISIADIENESVDYDALINNREALIEENKQGKINPKCEGCFHLEEKQWDEEPCIKYIHFNHWTYCNSDCSYCYTKLEKYGNGIQHYKALPILKEILKRTKFSPDGEITFAGGEPVLLDEFEEIIEYLLEIGAKKIIVHSSGIKYSPVLEKAIRENKVQLVISQDAGTIETYKKIKNVSSFDSVWENTKKYASFQQNSRNIFSKYVIVPKLNDNKKEIDEWLKRTNQSGVKSVIIDIEHNFYLKNMDNMKECFHILSLCEYVKSKAKALDIDVSFYNAALYLYEKYKFFIPFFKYKNYFIDLFILAFPLLIGNMGHSLIGLTDVLVVAKYNIDALAAISIANSIIFSIFIFGLGLIIAVSIILSNMRGARQGTKKYLLSTLIFSFVLSFIFFLLCYITKYFIPMLGFENHLVPYIEEYIVIVSFSMFGMFLFDGIKQFLQSYEIVNFPNFLLLAAVVLNIIFDIAFVFGFGFIPSMGSRGAAIATLSVRTIMGLILLAYVFRFIDFKSKIDFSYMKQLVKVGTPIGLALMLEFFAFNIVTILVGREAGVLAAVHNIVTTISSSTFMIPLAIATALSVKVAYYYGAKKPVEIKNFSIAGLVSGVGFMAFIAIILALFPSQIISLITNDVEVLKIALPIISIVAMYQIFDGFQVITGGILKGFKLTKFVSWAVFFGYWAVGMPTAFVLVGKYGLSLRGYWFALAVALCVMGFIQAAMAKYKFNKIKAEYK